MYLEFNCCFVWNWICIPAYYSPWGLWLHWDGSVRCLPPYMRTEFHLYRELEAYLPISWEEQEPFTISGVRWTVTPILQYYLSPSGTILPLEMEYQLWCRLFICYRILELNSHHVSLTLLELERLFKLMKENKNKLDFTSLSTRHACWLRCHLSFQPNAFYFCAYIDVLERRVKVSRLKRHSFAIPFHRIDTSNGESRQTRTQTRMYVPCINGIYSNAVGFVYMYRNLIRIRC